MEALVALGEGDSGVRSVGGGEGLGMESTEDQGAYQPRTPPMAEDDLVVQWLLQGDPAIRWQVLRDLVNASETEVATERARVEHEGWGARLLALRASDGLWANGACFPDTAAFAADTGTRNLGKVYFPFRTAVH